MIAIRQLMKSLLSCSISLCVSSSTCCAMGSVSQWCILYLRAPLLMTVLVMGIESDSNSHYYHITKSKYRREKKCEGVTDIGHIQKSFEVYSSTCVGHITKTL